MRRYWLMLVAGVALAGALLAARAEPLSLQDEAAAHKIYVSKCGKCHKFYAPAKYSDAQWHKWEQKMTKKAKLTPEQEKLLWPFLEEKYRKGSQTPLTSKAP